MGVSQAASNETKRKKKPFAALRGAMITCGLENTDLANIIGRSATHVSRCLNNKAQFTLSEQYIILRKLNRPVQDLHKLFPENGVDIIP